MKEIKLTKKEINNIEELIRKEGIGQTAFIQASAMLDDARRELWEELRRMYPEIEMKNATFNHIKGTLVMKEESEGGD